MDVRSAQTETPHSRAESSGLRETGGTQPKAALEWQLARTATEEASTFGRDGP